MIETKYYYTYMGKEQVIFQFIWFFIVLYFGGLDVMPWMLGTYLILPTLHLLKNNTKKGGSRG